MATGLRVSFTSVTTSSITGSFTFIAHWVPQWIHSPTPHFFWFSWHFDIFVGGYFVLFCFFKTALSLPLHSVPYSFGHAFSTTSSNHHQPFHPWSWLHNKTAVCSTKIISPSGNKSFHLLSTSLYIPVTQHISSSHFLSSPLPGVSSSQCKHYWWC